MLSTGSSSGLISASFTALPLGSPKNLFTLPSVDNPLYPELLLLRDGIIACVFF
jgi:hypothetical protein